MGVFHLKNKRFKVFCLFDMSGLMEAHVIRGSYRLLLIMCSMLDPWPRKAWSNPLEIQALKTWARDFDQGRGQNA